MPNIIFDTHRTRLTETRYKNYRSTKWLHRKTIVAPFIEYPSSPEFNSKNNVAWLALFNTPEILFTVNRIFTGHYSLTGLAHEILLDFILRTVSPRAHQLPGTWRSHELERKNSSGRTQWAQTMAFMLSGNRYSAYFINGTFEQNKSSGSFQSSWCTSDDTCTEFMHGQKSKYIKASRMLEHLKAGYF